MSQTIVVGRPPNFALIAAAFPEAWQKGVMFSWGDKIFLPDGGSISSQLKSHEAIHGQRQLAHLLTGTREQSIEAWWMKYIEDRQFRLDEELPAHRAEYRTFCALNKDRNVQNSFLQIVAGRLASKLYGSMIPLVEAKQLILSR